MVCPNPMSWKELGDLIVEGTLESLGKLGRSEADLKVYREFMAGVRNDYASVGDFIKIDVFEAAVHSSDGKKHAVDVEHASERVVWRLNDFPYNLEDGIQHWLLWSTRELAKGRMQQLIDDKFPAGSWDRLTFVNPAPLQSVLSVWHCHVIVRPKQQQRADEQAV